MQAVFHVAARGIPGFAARLVPLLLAGCATGTVEPPDAGWPDIRTDDAATEDAPSDTDAELGLDDGGESSSCTPGLAPCGGACVDLASDPANCGSCGHACPAGLHQVAGCEGGVCTTTCEAGWADLDGLPGCEYECPDTPESCNGIDDDCDGEVDEDFPCSVGETVTCTSSCGTAGSGTCTMACTLPAATDCTPPAETCNGRDDDCDGECDNGFACCASTTASCTDDGCSGTQSCSSDCVVGPCALGAAPGNDTCFGAYTTIAASGSWTFSTCGAAGDYTASCGSSAGSPDVVFQLSLSVRSNVTLEVTAATFDTVLHVHGGPSCLGVELACDDDGAGDARSRLSGTWDAGTYWVVVDGYSTPSKGTGTLQAAISAGTATQTVDFPTAADTRYTSAGTRFWNLGDYISGTRTTSLGTIWQAAMHLVVPAGENGLTCDNQDMRMLINGVEVGRFSIAPGAYTVDQTFGFSTLVGPSYTLRYETTRTVAGGCGSAGIGNTGGTVTLTGSP
ncbi:MAG: hypothetical protein JXB32_10470 [Deltaproteobacteria bacterium]|nr:hypothetical protein [Deltaproteobacteria bacterium]